MSFRFELITYVAAELRETSGANPELEFKNFTIIECVSEIPVTLSRSTLIR